MIQQEQKLEVGLCETHLEPAEMPYVLGSCCMIEPLSKELAAQTGNRRTPEVAELSAKKNHLPSPRIEPKTFPKSSSTGLQKCKNSSAALKTHAFRDEVRKPEVVLCF